MIANFLSNTEANDDFVWVGVTNWIGVFAPIFVTNQDHLIFCLVLLDLVRTAGDRSEIVLISGVLRLWNWAEREIGDGVVKVTNCTREIEGNGLVIFRAGNCLVVCSSVVSISLVWALVNRGAIRCLWNIEHANCISRTIGNYIGSKGTRDAILDIGAGDIAAIFKLHAIAKGELPGLIAI